MFSISVQGSIHMNMLWYSQRSAFRASLASPHRVSIREGFEWTEVEPPVRYMLQKRRVGAGREGETGGNRREEKQRR